MAIAIAVVVANIVVVVVAIVAVVANIVAIVLCCQSDVLENTVVENTNLENTNKNNRNKSTVADTVDTARIGTLEVVDTDRSELVGVQVEVVDIGTRIRRHCLDNIHRYTNIRYYIDYYK